MRTAAGLGLRIAGLVAAALVLQGGLAFAAQTYPDPIRDVKGGSGPDIVSIALSDTKLAVTFRVRFAKAPPLGFSVRERWADMLLIAVDVPPFGPAPATPGGPWLGADFALGTHGPSNAGQLVRLGSGTMPTTRRVATFGVAASGSMLTFSVPRRALGNPSSFRFTVAAARELEREGAGGGIDVAPARGVFRYALTR